MNGRETLIQDLIENINSMLLVIEEQETIEPEFTVVWEVATQLLEEVVALQE